MKRVTINFIIILLIILFSSCGIKKFPTIPFIKGAPHISKVNYKIKNGKFTLFWKNIKDKDERKKGIS